MGAELIVAAAGVLGAAIGVGGTVLGAHVTGRSQRDLEREEAQRKACESFVACLDIYLMVADEIAWARRGARKMANDPDQAVREFKNDYWSAWMDVLKANAALQLAARSKVSNEAAQIMPLLYDIDRDVWDFTHGYRQKVDLDDLKEKLGALRSNAIDLARQAVGSRP